MTDDASSTKTLGPIYVVLCLVQGVKVRLVSSVTRVLSSKFYMDICSSFFGFMSFLGLNTPFIQLYSPSRFYWTPHVHVSFPPLTMNRDLLTMVFLCTRIRNIGSVLFEVIGSVCFEDFRPAPDFRCSNNWRLHFCFCFCFLLTPFYTIDDITSRYFVRYLRFPFHTDTVEPPEILPLFPFHCRLT